jgi:two-component system, NarL family, sensor histidine kinase YdfH
MQRIRSVFRPWLKETEAPFMVFLTLVFVFIYFWTVVNAVPLRSPPLLIIFTLVFIVHLTLHWTSLNWMRERRNVLLYLGLQSALVFALGLMARSLGPLIGLYLGMIGESVGMLQTPRRIAAGVAFFMALSAGNYLLVTSGEGWQWWILAIIPMTFFVIIYVVLYSRQAEARLRAQTLAAELAEANRQLTDYADRIEDLTLANERARVARELHDTLAQGLAGLILQLEAADSHLAAGRADRARGIVEQAMIRARSTLADSRRVIDDLRSGRWDGVDLSGAIRREVEGFTESTGTPCRFEMVAPEELAEPHKELIYRAVTEGLSNVARHAGAGKAEVSVRREGTRLVVVVADDGRGFDPAAISPGHYGLLGLRERARGAGGAVEILSGAGNGTTLRLTLPLGPVGAE